VSIFYNLENDVCPFSLACIPAADHRADVIGRIVVSVGR
jgi:hypothetical protein